MDEKKGIDKVEIGMEFGPWEIKVDQGLVNEQVALHQWKPTDIVDEHHIAPPGITIDRHAKMKFAALPDMKAGIWAGSEHEFIKPIKIGTTITIRGIVKEKIIKRGRPYVITDYETRDENGELLMKSRETGLYVE